MSIMTTIALAEMATDQVEPAENGGIYKAPHNKGLSWYADWYDHAGRLIKRRLGTVVNLGNDENYIWGLAYEAVQEYMVQQYDFWLERNVMSPDELDERAAEATFPREVVAREILRICERISRDGYEEAHNGRPGLKLFADRVGISSREIHRIIEDPSRITVGIDAVDKICCEFDMVFQDFIESAFQWATKTGAWATRAGLEDPWPCGYTPLSPRLGDDII